jgi:phosphatidylglycerophosphatase A
MRAGVRSRAGIAVATLGGLGRLPAPGTFASLATLPLAWALHATGGIVLMVVATAAIWLVGWWASIEYLAGRVEDPPEIVIDEVAGQLVALWPLSWGLTAAGAESHVWPWPGWMGGFLLFRFFDIVKPWPVSLANRPGAFPLMIDDIVAGAIAGMLMLLAAGVAHGWF